MTNQKKRSLEHEINAKLYRNMTREGIPMDHLDPTHLANWPLLEHQANKGDYVNLLPPSYRNPFHQNVSAVTQKRQRSNDEASVQAQDFKDSLANEWSISNAPETIAVQETPRSRGSILLITIAGLLMAASLALNSTLFQALFIG